MIKVCAVQSIHVSARHMLAGLIGLGFCLAGSIGAQAHPHPSASELENVEWDDPEALFARGAYDRAAEIAAAKSSADMLALAARARAAQAILAGDEDRATAQRVQNLAQQALELDAGHEDARLQLAVGYWLEGRSASAVESFMRNLPGRGREAIAHVLETAPENAWAHALMGAWHFEVLRRGGRRGAAHYGADLQDGVDHFYTALRLDPDNAAIALQAAVSFLALDQAQYRPHARAVLRVALQAEADDAFEAALIERAQRLSVMLDDEEPTQVRRELAFWTEQ